MGINSLTIASDHGALDLKQALIDYLAKTHPEISVNDRGVNDTSSVDYPDIAVRVVKDVQNKLADVGILCCGTGIGMSIKANRSKGIRAALVYDKFTAEMAKAHNNANVLCMGGRTSTPESAIEMLETWLSTDFEGGRHQRRVDKLDS